MRFKVFPYKLGSQSAKALANGLGVKRISNEYEPRRNDVVINWGNSRAVRYVRTSLDLNKHEAIALASNKIKTFNKLNGLGFEHIPDYTIHKEEASEWIAQGNKVYCRTSVTGHSGQGIVIADSLSSLIDAPLYTKATKHKHEFRVHVFKGKVIDVQQKKRRLDYTGPNTGIRNHSNGYIYARVDVDVPPLLLSSSVQAVDILGLDFGAVDVGYRERNSRVFIFEVNTAPGLVGTTLDKYVNTFKEYLNGL
jgi:glutathione synthase/RimK-type ligase-like ATP-grasp enzyme